MYTKPGHANINKHLTDKNRNGLSDHPDFKILGCTCSITPQPPYGSHLRCLQDSSVIEKCPNYTYSKGWTVCVSTRYNNIVSWRPVQAFTNRDLKIPRYRCTGTGSVPVHVRLPLESNAPNLVFTIM